MGNLAATIQDVVGVVEAIARRGGQRTQRRLAGGSQGVDTDEIGEDAVDVLVAALGGVFAQRTAQIRIENLAHGGDDAGGGPKEGEGEEEGGATSAEASSGRRSRWCCFKRRIDAETSTGKVNLRPVERDRGKTSLYIFFGLSFSNVFFLLFKIQRYSVSCSPVILPLPVRVDTTGISLN